MTYQFINYYISHLLNFIEQKKRFWRPGFKILAIAITTIYLIAPHISLAAEVMTMSDKALNAPAITDHPTIEQLRWQTTADEQMNFTNKTSLPIINEAKPRLVVTMAITAYTSRIGETDNAPCITASGLNVCERNIEDIVATNFNYLPFGTYVKIPQLFGNRVFMVHDRMNRRYTKTVDVWFKELADAKNFGRQWARVEIF